MIAGELESAGIPTIAVLGNHDYQSGAEGALATILEHAGICVLDGGAVLVEVSGSHVGIAGAKGFGGGFVGVCATEFGEPEVKAFVHRAEVEAASLASGLQQAAADVVIALTHYAPTDSTLAGEPPEVHPLLGSYQLGEVIDASRAVLAVHVHAHRGVEIGSTLGGVQVRNGAQPVIKRAYRIHGIDERDGKDQGVRVGPNDVLGV